MILPTKHLRVERSLLSIAGEILISIDRPKTISRIWSEFSSSRSREEELAPVSYDWFILALDLLFLIGTVQFRDGRLVRTIK